MLLQPLTIAAAGLAAVTQAFLVPPEVSDNDVELMESVGVALPVFQKWKVDLECPGCPPLVQTDDDATEAGTSGASHLDLTFAVAQGTDGDRLLVNDFEIYPNTDPFHSVLTAAQIPDQPSKPDGFGTTGKTIQSHHKMRRPIKKTGVDRTLGFGVGTQSLTKDVNDQMELIAIDFQIIEVGDVFVDSLPSIHLKLVKMAGGELMIANATTEESQSLSNPAEHPEECSTLLCWWRAMVLDRVNKMKQKHCGYKAKTKGKHHHHHHHHHHKGSRPNMRVHEHSWGQLLRMFTHHILVPVAVGIVAGVSVSVLGMMVGTVLVGLWRKFVRGQSFFRHAHCRRHHHSGRSHKAAPKEVAVEEEKSGLIEHQDAPPSYEEEVARKPDAQV